MKGSGEGADRNMIACVADFIWMEVVGFCWHRCCRVGSP